MTTQPLSALTMLLSRHTRRREFITLLGGAAAWPLAARAQQPEGMRRIGVLMGLPEDDPETKARAVKFRQELERLGWAEGRNVPSILVSRPLVRRRRFWRKNWSTCGRT